jgi:dolichol-phosphate mannosyltransferase
MESLMPWSIDHMVRLSLILPVEPGDTAVGPAAEAIRQALDDAGIDTEVIFASDSAVDRRKLAIDDHTRVIETVDRGRCASALTALDQTDAPFAVILDPSRGYETSEVVSVAKRLLEDQADLVIASRRLRFDRPATLRAHVARRIAGSTDPLSGLIGVTRPAFAGAREDFLAVGSLYTLELLAKVSGDSIDVPCASPGRSGRSKWIGLNDLRHAKRLADHRFGNFSRLIQFCAVGASGMVIDLSLYALFQWVFAHTALAGRIAPLLGPLDLAVAAFLAVAIALCWNFSLNRRLTFSYARHGSIVRQFVTYVFSNAVAVSLNLTLRLTLPRVVPFFNAHRLAAAVVGVVTATGLSFSMSRWFVFSHAKAKPPTSASHQGDAPCLLDADAHRNEPTAAL